METDMGKCKKATGSAGMKKLFGDTNGMKKPGEKEAPRSSGTDGKKKSGMKSGY